MGYRTLNIGEVIQSNDEFLGDDNEWIKFSRDCSWAVGAKVASAFKPIRRAVKSFGEKDVHNKR